MSTNTPPISAREQSSGMSGRVRTIAFTIVALAFVMDLLDSTIVNIAIPSIQSNLGLSNTMIQWLVAGYSLAFALLLITAGRMGDVFGYKKLFLIGVGGFTLASLCSGLAWTPEVLVTARLAQGAMAALMVPQVLSLLQVMYKPEERASVNGLFGMLGGVSAAMGPVIGGLLISANVWGLHWRPIFLINVPIGILGLIAGTKYLPNGKSAHPLKLDLVGTGLIIVALTLLVFPLIEGRALGWPTWTYTMMVASLPVLAIFAWWQRRKDAADGSALVLPALFKKRSFSLGLVVNVVFLGAMLSFFLTFTLLLQAGLGFSVVHAAVTGIPTAVGIALSIAFLGEKFGAKLGRYAITLGTVVMAIGLLAILAIINHEGLATHGLHLAPALFVTGLGMGLILMKILAITLNDVDQNHAGSASGTVNAVQQVGGAIGVAVIGIIFFGQITAHVGNSFDAAVPELRAKLTAQHVPAGAQTAVVTGVKQCFSDRVKQKDATVLPESCQQTGGPSLDAGVNEAIIGTIRTANADNFNHAFKWGVVYGIGLLALTFVLSFFLPRHTRQAASTDVVA